VDRPPATLSFATAGSLPATQGQRSTGYPHLSEEHHMEDHQLLRMCWTFIDQPSSICCSLKRTPTATGGLRGRWLLGPREFRGYARPRCDASLMLPRGDGLLTLVMAHGDEHRPQNAFPSQMQQASFANRQCRAGSTVKMGIGRLGSLS
jgi:hypothetical protein